jgi:hypothetical protein
MTLSSGSVKITDGLSVAGMIGTHPASASTSDVMANANDSFADAMEARINAVE